VNGSQLAFGVRQNGQPVNNVQLPPWANGPDDLLAKHRWVGVCCGGRGAYQGGA
jgi:hypothetical protein